MKSPSPRSLLRYAAQCLGLEKYLYRPGDGRPQPRIPARARVGSILIARRLREISFHAVEQLVRSCCRALSVAQSFGADALGYFTERLDPAVTRAAWIGVLRRAKRNQAFQDSRSMGRAIDDTTAGHSTSHGCELCRPQDNAKKEVIGYSHRMASISVVGTGLSLPFDAEPYGPGAIASMPPASASSPASRANWALAPPTTWWWMASTPRLQRHPLSPTPTRPDHSRGPVADQSALRPRR